VKLEFAEDEEQSFFAARDLLLERFNQWARQTMDVAADGVDELASNARLALDWKWNYGDRCLARWTTNDVTEFLLEWCPRKLSVAPADALGIPPALAAFFAFLEEEELLDSRSSFERLADTVLAAAEEFASAMADRSKFGMAKSLFAAARDDGVQEGDVQGLQAWMDRFNDLPFEERERILPDSALFGPTRRPTLPPIPIPDDDEVAASIAAAPVLRMLAEFAAFFSPDRKLTQKGNITLADARELVGLLGANDVVDEVIGDHTFRTTTSDDLLGLRQIFAWAKKAGVVRVVHGKVTVTKRGLGLSADPAASFDRVVDGLFAIGPLSSLRHPDAWFAWPEVTEFLDHMSPVLLAGAYAAGRPMPIEDVAELATTAVLDTFEFRVPDEEVGRRILTDVTDIMDSFELAGLVRRSGAEPAEWGNRSLGGTVEITPAGVMAVRRILGARGCDTPAAGQYAAASATELLVATDHEDLAVFHGELQAWRHARTPEQAADELAAAFQEIDDPGLKVLALGIMADVGVDVAAPRVRSIASDPAAKGFCLCWLVDHGQGDETELLDRRDPYPFVDVLAYRLAISGPEALHSTLSLSGSPDDEVRLLEGLWRAPSTATESVLEAVGRTHPSKAVAKAARKALFKRRSWSASPSSG